MLYSQSPNLEANFDFSNATAFEAFSDNAQASTTSTTYQTKLTGTSATSDNGSYVLQWYSEIANSNNNATSKFRVQWKNTSSGTWIDLSEIDAYIGRTDVFIQQTGFKVINNVFNDSIDFRVQYARGSGGIARIQNANFYFFRVLPT